MKKLFLIIIPAFLFIACNNAGETTQDKKDSLDSIATEQKDMIDSTAEQKMERVDSITEEKKDVLDRKDSVNRVTQQETSE
jgi:hypothetical protein